MKISITFQWIGILYVCPAPLIVPFWHRRRAYLTVSALHNETEIEMPHDEIEATARAEFFANTLGLTAPGKLVADDGAPSKELLDFCRKTGMSLDWVFLGDLRPMVRATYRSRHDVR